MKSIGLSVAPPSTRFLLPQVFYGVELIMKHSADLLTWKIGNYGVAECGIGGVQLL